VADSVTAGRLVEVDGRRLDRWCQGFAVRHGGDSDRGAEPGAIIVDRDRDALLLTAPDGATARIRAPFSPPSTVTDVSGLVEWVLRPRRCAVLLVRRGGYACVLLDGARVTSSKVGTRYVQSRTAAGGWSQQRFARRREGQARELVGAVVQIACRVLLVAQPADWLVTGGDRPLVDEALADPRLRELAALPRGPHLAIGDPRSDVVRAVPDLVSRVRILLNP
jgi:hypothetical protein